jgi:hypothetical protein
MRPDKQDDERQWRNLYPPAEDVSGEAERPHRRPKDQEFAHGQVDVGQQGLDWM